MAIVKAITLWQPWASLVVHGLKEYETRSWYTRYRGPLVIHAAMRSVRKSDFNFYYDLLERCNLWKKELVPRAALVGIVELENIFPAEDVTVGKWELHLGDYSSGRFAWKLVNPRPLPCSIPMRGQQGLWSVVWDDDWLSNPPVKMKEDFRDYRW